MQRSTFEPRARKITVVIHWNCNNTPHGRAEHDLSCTYRQQARQLRTPVARPRPTGYRTSRTVRHFPAQEDRCAIQTLHTSRGQMVSPHLREHSGNGRLPWYYLQECNGLAAETAFRLLGIPLRHGGVRANTQDNAAINVSHYVSTSPNSQARDAGTPPS